MTDSVGNGVVFDPKSIDWSGDDFEMPGWDDLVVYEIHIATFAADENGPAPSTRPSLGSITSPGWASRPSR